MARPRHDDPALFTGAEIETATGIGTRNLQMVRDLGFGPFAQGAPRGGLYSESDMANLVMTSATAGAGLSIKLAAAVIDAFLWRHPRQVGARFCLIDSLDPPEDRDSPRSPRYRPKVLDAGRTWFERYVAMRRWPDADDLRLGDASTADAIVILCDGRLIYEGAHVRPRLRVLAADGVDPLGPWPLGEIEGLRRGADPVFRPFDERTDLSTAEEWAAAEARLQRAAGNAVATLRVNLSLALRRAFGAIFDRRQERGGPWWTS